MLVCDRCRRSDEEPGLLVTRRCVSIHTPSSLHLSRGLGIDYQATIELCHDCGETLSSWIQDAIRAAAGKGWSDELDRAR